MESGDAEEEGHATVFATVASNTIQIQLSPPNSWTVVCAAADAILAPNLHLAPHYMWRMSSNAAIVVAEQMSGHGQANDGLDNGASSRPGRPYLSLERL